MAQIIETPRESRSSWVAQVKWADGINDNLIEPYASAIADELTNKNYRVDYYHANEFKTKKTNFTITALFEVSTPEQPARDWEKAVKGIQGAVSCFFEYNRGFEIPPGERGNDDE